MQTPRRYRVSWHDDGGDHQTGTMTRAEADQVAAGLRFRQATSVQVVPVRKPQAVYGPGWRVI